MRTTRKAAILSVLCGLFLLSLGAQEPAALTNKNIVEMVQAGFEEATIVKTIQTSRCAFDTSVNALLELKGAGVSEKVIAAMLETKHSPPAEPKPPKNPLLPDDVGVYLVRGGKLDELHVEIVAWRTGGVAKSLFLGTKGHINGVVKGPQSETKVGMPFEVVVRCPEAVDIVEYQLLKLDEKKDRREFRALTGGYIHASGGLDKNALKYRFEKIAPRTYRIVFENHTPGEYGLLAPGSGTFGSIGGGVSGTMVMQGTATAGKMYTFRIVE